MQFNVHKINFFFAMQNVQSFDVLSEIREALRIRLRTISVGLVKVQQSCNYLVNLLFRNLDSRTYLIASSIFVLSFFLLTN